MENIIKKAVEEKVEEYMKERNERTDKEEEPQQRKKKKTEMRLGNLLSRIRSSSSTSSSATSLTKTGKKKHIYIKWMRYCPVKEKFITVKSSEGGGARYVEWVDGEPLLFKELKSKAIKIFFEDGKSSYHESVENCTFQLVDQSEKPIDEETNLWEHLAQKGIFISKTKFILHSIDNDYLVGEKTEEELHCPTSISTGNSKV